MKFKPYEELVQTQISVDDSLKLTELEHKLGYRDWIQYIPFITFPPEWEVQVIPPFAGAIGRFRVRLKDYPDSCVSVYLDAYNNLGYFSFGEYDPYWEVMPVENDEPSRCAMDEVDQLIELIRTGLASRRAMLENRRKCREGMCQ